MLNHLCDSNYHHALIHTHSWLAHRSSLSKSCDHLQYPLFETIGRRIDKLVRPTPLSMSEFRCIEFIPWNFINPVDIIHRFTVTILKADIFKERGEGVKVGEGTAPTRFLRIPFLYSTRSIVSYLKRLVSKYGDRYALRVVIYHMHLPVYPLFSLVSKSNATFNVFRSHTKEMIRPL